MFVIKGHILEKDVYLVDAENGLVWSTDIEDALLVEDHLDAEEIAVQINMNTENSLQAVAFAYDGQVEQEEAKTSVPMLKELDVLLIEFEEVLKALRESMGKDSRNPIINIRLRSVLNQHGIRCGFPKEYLDNVKIKVEQKNFQITNIDLELPDFTRTVIIN